MFRTGLRFPGALGDGGDEVHDVRLREREFSAFFRRHVGGHEQFGDKSAVLPALVGFLALWVDKDGDGVPDQLEKEDTK